MTSEHLIYREIFIHKIKHGSRILLNTDKNNIELNNDIINTMLLSIQNIKTLETIDLTFDVIIFENIFNSITCNSNDSTMNKLIQDYKKYLKLNGVIMFINTVSLYPDNSVIIPTVNYWINFITGIDICPIYIDDVYTKLRENDLRVIDSYRLISNDYKVLQSDIFLITCIIMYNNV